MIEYYIASYLIGLVVAVAGYIWLLVSDETVQGTPILAVVLMLLTWPLLPVYVFWWLAKSNDK